MNEPNDTTPTLDRWKTVRERPGQWFARLSEFSPLSMLGHDDRWYVTISCPKARSEVGSFAHCDLDTPNNLRHPAARIEEDDPCMFTPGGESIDVGLDVVEADGSVRTVR